MTGSGVEALVQQVDELLAGADDALRSAYPGEPSGRQPVHTVYVPADRYTADLVQEWGTRATQALERHAATPLELAAVLDGRPPESAVADEVYSRVVHKLSREPIEDLRIDFEDGYGDRGDSAEDDDARAAAQALAAAVRAGTAPPFVGIRFKSLEAPTRRRGLRTLDLFVATLVLSVGELPAGFVVTLPKVTSVDQVEAMVTVCEWLEQAHGLDTGTLRFEVQVETPQAVLGADGTAPVARMVHAAAGRCTGLHYGTYDYSASCGIAARYQSMEHPAADHAKAVMQVAAAGTGVRLSDGSTNVLPVGDREQVHAAWRLHARLVRRGLERGFYQGWDLHPAQLPTRYAAVYLFYREGLAASAERLRGYLQREDSGFLDEPATARALAGFLLRATDCGAADAVEVEALTGADVATLTALAGRQVAS